MRKLILVFISIISAITIIILLLSLEEKSVKSIMIGKKIPVFNLKSYDNHVLNSKHLKHDKFIINIFASWCKSCLAEHTLLMQFKNDIPIYGIAWKDKESDNKAWLNKYGNPYKQIGFDNNGQVIIKLGVSGAPESFLMNKDGVILDHIQGIISKDILNKWSGSL